MEKKQHIQMDKNINLDLKNLEHKCSTKPGSSGWPIINLNNNRVAVYRIIVNIIYYL